MKIYLDESPPASGKTERKTMEIAQMPSKYLFITERIGRFDELIYDIRRFAAAKGTKPLIRKVHSNPSKGGISVGQKIAALPSEYAKHSHVIVLATHAAMLRSDFSGFNGWTIIVDEVPQFLDFEEKRTHLDAAFFKKYYHLEPLKDGWSSVRLSDIGKGLIAEDGEEGKGKALTAADVRADESHKHLTVFHSRIIEASREGSTRYVLCNLPDWDAMSGREVSWGWASVFSLWELEPFDRVELLGNRFRSDIGSILSETVTSQPIEWETLPPIEQKLEFMHRSVHIHYFSETRRSSKCSFETEEGQAMLSNIGAYLSKELPKGASIWTANDPSSAKIKMTPKQAIVQGGLPEEQYLPPRQSGTNMHQDKNHAAMIYSAKPSTHLISLLKMLQVPVEKWAQSVEHEAVLQFMSRTSVRNRGNTSPVHMWVYDRDQALYLKEHFDGLRHVTATMQWVEDGPEIPVQSKRGPKAAVRTAAEEAEYLSAKRRKDAERNRRNRAKKKKVAKARDAA